MRAEWLEVPWEHQGRSRNAVDCLGLFVCSGRECGLEIKDNLNYRRSPDYQKMVTGLLDHMIQIPRKDLRIGDVLFIRWPRRAHPQHLAAISLGTSIKSFQIIHAPQSVPRKSCEHAMPRNWWPQVSMCLRWKAWAD